MPFDSIRLPADSTGKHLATRKAVGEGPSGADVHFEVDVMQPDNGVGNVLHDQPLTELPTVATAVVAVTIALDRLVLHNNSGSTRTVTITDGQVTPRYLLNTQMPAGAIWNFDFGGIRLTSGIKWNADAAGVYGALKGFKAAS